MSIENIPAIHNKENYYECEKEYKQSAQEWANDAVEFAKDGDWEGYERAQAHVSEVSNWSRECGDKVEIFNE